MWWLRDQFEQKYVGVIDRYAFNVRASHCLFKNFLSKCINSDNNNTGAYQHSVFTYRQMN